MSTHMVLMRAGVTPTDTYTGKGFLGQFIVVVPSRQLVIVRLGDTALDSPAESPAKWSSLFGSIISAFPAAAAPAPAPMPAAPRSPVHEPARVCGGWRAGAAAARHCGSGKVTKARLGFACLFTRVWRAGTWPCGRCPPRPPRRARGYSSRGRPRVAAACLCNSGKETSPAPPL